jgi:hypothetical protein
MAPFQGVSYLFFYWPPNANRGRWDDDRIASLNTAAVAAKLPALNISLAQPTTTSLSTGAVFGRALSDVSADFAAGLTAAGGLLENLPNGAAVYPNASAATTAVKVQLSTPPPPLSFSPFFPPFRG